MIYAITCFFSRILFRILFRYKAYGIENIPREGSFVLVSNHVSYLDPLAAGVFLKRQVNYIAKKELFKNRFFGWYLRRLRTIPIDRDAPAFGGMREAIRRIRRGDAIAIFPEGRRLHNNSFLQPEQGAAYFALKFDLPVVPAYIEGTDEVFPKGAHFIRLRSVRVYYGEPKKYRMPDVASKDEAYRRVSLKIMEEIKALKERHIGSQGYPSTSLGASKTQGHNATDSQAA